MYLSTHKLAFPRRVVGLYLMFCLGAVLLLGVGIVFTVQTLIQSQASGSALSRLGRLAAAIELDQIQTEGSQAPALLDQAKRDGHLEFAAVVGPDGRFTAHTDRSLIGALAVESTGTQLQWGTIGGVRYRDADNRVVNEYQSPLRVNETQSGRLLVATIEPGWRGTLVNLAEYAPLAILAPTLLIALGCWWLSRTASPVAEIESRLAAIARLPHQTAPHLEPTSPTGLAAVGWNRLVEYFEEATSQAAIDPEAQLLQQSLSTSGGCSQEAIHSLAEGIAITDAEGRIDFANRAITALLGQEGNLDGASFDEFLRELNPEQCDAIHARNRDIEAISELTIDTDHGARTLRIARTPLASGSSAGHVWSLRDITQQKLAEAARNQFIDTATHELRTPLANIKAYAETLAMGDLNDVEQQKEFCNTINSEATRLARFVDDLLSISSLEVGSLGANRQNVKVSRLLEEAIDKIKPLMKQESLKFDVKLSEKLGEAQLDKDKISGLLVNLLGNAAKYTPAGGTVSLRAARRDEGIVIEVQDTGVGISPEEQTKVFDKFFRSDNPEVRDIVGTGLGLSLAREIARLHRGDLTLQSVLGEGSTFTVTLPVS